MTGRKAKTMKTEKLWMRLDLFGEEEAAPAAEAGEAAPAAGTEGAESAGVSANPTREGRRIFPAVEKTEVRRARPQREARQTPAAMREPQAQAAQAAEEPKEPTFEELIRGKYKAEYGQAVQAAIQQRFRNQQDSSEQLQRTMKVLGSIAPLYGVQVDDEGGFDLDKLSDAIENDDRLYEEEALAKGVPVSTMKQLKQLEAKEREHEAERRQSLEQERLRQHVEGLRQQEAEMKRDFPDFDLMREVQGNPAFARMTAPGGGLTVRQAYMAVHGDELMQRQAQAVQRQAVKDMSRAIQAGSVRPQENGMAQSGGGQQRIDPRHMTRAEREEIRRRVRSGERVII